MPEQSWIPIDHLGEKGIEPDLMPPHRDPNSLDEATNVRAIGPNLGNAGGFTKIQYSDSPPGNNLFNTFFPVKSTETRRIVLTAQDAIYMFYGGYVIDPDGWRDITGDPVDDGVEARWTGGWLAGGLTLANTTVVRTFKPGVDGASVPMIYNGGAGAGDETWESKGYSAEVFRPFREYMLAANVNWNGDIYPSRVQWCDPVEPGQVPEDWVPSDDNRAGDVDLADTPGSIVDMIPLRDSLMIYKRDSIFTCQWVGGNSVFSFRRLTSTKGIHSRDCVVEYNGAHWCQGIEDIFVVDGNTSRSLIWGKIKRSWLKDRDEDRAINNWTALDPVNEEVLFAYVSQNAPPSYNYPDKMIVYSLRNNCFMFREYGREIPHAKVSLDVVDEDSSNMVFYAIDRANQRLLDLESAPDRLGFSVQFSFGRTALFADPGVDFAQVDRVKLSMTGQGASIRLGGQIAIDAPIIWRDAKFHNPLTDYKTDVRINDNLVAYTVYGQTTTDWQIASISLQVQRSGGRG